ncbi:hypothetical protein ABIB57_005206 [Devosia sp. UYZn731]|uniref:hypothetical protein n=1 Tax=Devosia sp. UYZn731 TaxID=3156345 RepID=UPI0033959904
MNAAWLLGIILTTTYGATALAQAAQSVDLQFQNALTACSRAFEDLLASDEIWVSADFCELTVPDLGTIEFGVTKGGSSLFMQSDLLSYSALYAPSGFFLQPTRDPETYRLGARTEGQPGFVYLHKEFGGVFSYAHFVQDRATWIRRNQTLAVCV